MNYFKTALLLAAMTAIFLTVGYFIGGQTGLLIAIVVALGMNVFAYWNSDKMVLRMANAQEIGPQDAPEFYGIVQRHGVDGLLVATLMAGGILIALGLARLGTAIKFIPFPVVTGFTAAIGAIIAVQQLRDAFGLRLDHAPAEFIERIEVYLQHADTVNLYAVALTAITLVIVLLWPRLSHRIPSPFVALIVPFILVFIVDGMRGLRQTWPVVFVGAVTFGVLQYATSNFISVELTDIVASLGSVLSMVAFLQVWQPSEPLEGDAAPGGARPAIAGAESANPVVEREVGRPQGGGDSAGAIARAYAPYLIIIAVFAIAQIGPVKDFLASGAASRVRLEQLPFSTLPISTPMRGSGST